jgi:parallel beta-helix repeat protein
MAGGFGSNIRVEDCILRRNNQFPDAPGGNAGASKFLYSQHMRVRRVISYDNFGPGWWMDWDNSDYLIEGCTIFANHAGHALENGQKLVDQPWAAAGIWSEGNSGHGEILNNVIFSNVAAGIGIFDSRDIIVRGNTIVDCGTGIEFRDLNRDGDVPEAQRTRNIENILVENNRIKAWRGDAAMLTSVGEFRRGQRPADYNVTIDRNVYDPAGAEARGFFRWIKVHAATLDETRGRLGIEANGRIEPFDFPVPLIATRSTDQAVLKSADPDRFRQVDSRQAEASGFDEALAAAREGQVVSLQVHGRTPGTTQGEAMSCDVYDLARKRHIAVTVGKDAWPAFAARVPEYAVLRPVPVRVRLVSLEPYRLSATLLEGDAQPSPADPR